MENKKITRIAVKRGQKPTNKQIEEIKAAKSKEVVFDDISRELTMKQYAQMAEIARARKARQVKPVVALRVKPETLQIAKATGKGYTGFLSRLLDNAIQDKELVAKSL